MTQKKKVTSNGLMDKPKALVIRADLVKAVEKVAELHGLEGHVDNARYDTRMGTYTPQVWFAEPGYAEREFEEYADRVGLDPADYGRVFTHKGTEYKIAAVKPQSPKYPAIVERTGDGQKVKFTLPAILKALGR